MREVKHKEQLSIDQFFIFFPYLCIGGCEVHQVPMQSTGAQWHIYKVESVVV